MRRALLAVALILFCAAPSWAQNTRLAVFLQAQTGLGVGTLEPYYLTDFMLLNQLGISYDVYDANVRSWGETGVADSTWFRERYGAVWIPYLQDNANRSVNAYALRFLNAAGTAGWDKSPITGKWSIPVYARNGVFGLASECQTPTLVNDSLRTGLILPTRAASVVPESLGTWRDRSLSVLRPGRIDTLYNRPTEIGVRSPTGMLGQYCAAVTWMDTTNAPVNADTLFTTWRYKPLGPTTPGIVFSILESQYTSNVGTCTGQLVLLQLMLGESTVKAARKIPVAITIHHPQPGRTPDATVDGMVDQLLDAHERAGLYTYGAFKLAPVEWGDTGAGGTTAGWDRIRQHVRDGWMVWYPHSHASAFDYDEADSVGMRVSYNEMVRAGAAPDSFNLPIARYWPNRIVPANDIMTRQAAASTVRAGMRTLEVVLAAATTGADRFSQPRYAGTTSQLVPGVTQPFFTKQSFDMGWQGDFATFKGTTAFSATLRGKMAQLETAALAGNGVYWHMDLIAGNTAGTPYTDPFNAWIIEHAVGNWFKSFDRVIAIDRPGTDPRLTPAMRTARP